MTIKEFVISECVSRGMFEDQAEEVFQKLFKVHPEMEGRWDEPIEAYPKTMLASIRVSVVSEGKKWIEKNVPQAFYRKLFDQ